MPTTLAAEARHDVRVEDVEYQRQGGPAAIGAALPAEPGPARFPAAVQVHGGESGGTKDRTDNDFMARALAESGILVAAIDFRMPPEAPYPASLADINLATRWLKANARRVSEAALTGSAALARRAAGIRYCWRRCGPTTSATARCGWPTRRRSTPGSPLSFPAGACSTRCCATSSPKRPATPS